MKHLHWFLLLLVTVGYSQDTIYLNENYTETGKKSAAYYWLIDAKPDGSGLTTEKTFFLDNKIKLEEVFKNYNTEDQVRVEFTEYYRNGQPHLTGNYRPGNVDHYLTSYWENGQLKRKDVYKKGRLVSGTCWNEEGVQVPFYDYEMQPQFPGGMPVFQLYLKNKLGEMSIPSTFKGSKVLVKFTIDEKGDVNQVQILKSLDPKVEKEVKKVFEEMPQWAPARQDGDPIAVVRNIYVVF